MTQTSSPGRQAARNNPGSSAFAAHWQSCTSPLAAGHILELARVDQPDRQAMLFQRLIHWDLITQQTHGGELGRLAHPVGGVPGARRQDLVAADLGTGTRPQPRSEVFDAVKAVLVRANLRQDRQCRGDSQAIDARQVPAGPAR